MSHLLNGTSVRKQRVWETLLQKKELRKLKKLSKINMMQFRKGNMQNVMLDLVKLKDGVTRQRFC